MLRKTVKDNNEWELIDWDTEIIKYRERLEDKEKDIKERREKASRKEKSWELLRCYRDYIKTNSTSWKAEERIRKEEREQER